MSRGLVNKSTGERIPSAPGYIVDKVGDLSALHTTAKDKAVSAINEVADAVSAIDDGTSIDSFADVENALADKTDTDMVAADFNAGTSYTAGNYCVQDGKLYRFKNNHSGAWSASDVEEVKIAGELATLKSGLTNVANQLIAQNTRVYFKPNYRNNANANVKTVKNIPASHVGLLITSSGIYVFKSNAAGNGFEVPQGGDLTITNTGDSYTFSCPGAWYTMCLFIFTWDPDYVA